MAIMRLVEYNFTCESCQARRAAASAADGITAANAYQQDEPM